jgi:hypothetical protein
MVNRISKNSITISRKAVQKKGGIVVLPLKEYKRFLREELEKEYIDRIVAEGLEDEKKGKTESLESFLKREYLTFYEKHSKG